MYQAQWVFHVSVNIFLGWINLICFLISDVLRNCAMSPVTVLGPGSAEMKDVSENPWFECLV